MVAVASPTSRSIHTHSAGSSTIVFTADASGLSVEITTPRLRMRSIQATPEEYARYAGLFGNKVVMEKFADGKPRTLTEVQATVNKLVKRWCDKDPYSGFAVFKRGTNSVQDPDVFIGHVVLGHDKPGVAALAGLGHVDYWNQGYGTEAAKVLLTEYAPATIKEGYTLEGRSITNVTATARVDNEGSGKVLGKMGMKVIGQVIEHGALRNQYSLDLTSLPGTTAAKVAGRRCCCLF